jgi:drug/metabolite transporter (DMT)-like permease
VLKPRPALEGSSAVVGILMALVANLLFTTSDAIVKTLTARYPVVQVVTMQVGFAFIPLIVMTIRDGTFSHLRIVHPLLVAIRGLCAGIGTLCGFFAFSILPLADVYAIAFCAPMVVTIASIPVLGEQVGRYRFAAILVGFIGILIMVRPGVTPLSLGHAAAFGSVFTSAAVVLIMRRIGREEQRGVMVAAVLAGLLVVSLPGTLAVGRWPAPQDLAFAAASGLLMGSAQFFTLEALRRAPAASVAPMQYTMLVWALVYGTVLFGDPVQLNVLVGAAIVILSSLTIVHRERVRAREKLTSG